MLDTQSTPRAVTPDPSETEKTQWRKTEPNNEQHQRQSPSISSSSENSKVNWKPHPRVFVVLITLCVVVLMAALDATSLSVALPIMAEKLGGSAIEAFWAGTSFLLTSTVFQPSFASFSHIFGRKPMILIALVFFTIGAIVAALAKSFTAILIGRSIQGIGGGGIISLSEIILTDLVPLRERGKYFGFLSVMWAVGSVSGPLIGGAFSQKVSWTWVFWINLPFAAIGFVMIPLFLRLNYKTSNFVDKLKRVDWVGSFLFIASTTSMLIPITWGGVMYEWTSWRTLVPLILSFAGLASFILYEIYLAAEPVIRLHIFLNRTSAANYIGTVMHGIILWCLLYYLPLYYEAIKGMTPILSGVAILPQTLTVAPASVVVGIIVSITGKFRTMLWLGWLTTIVGMGIMYLLDVHTPTVSWIFLNLVGGLGTGVLFPSMAFAIQAAAKDEDAAYAVAMYSFFRTYGQSLGVAIGGTIFQNALARKLEKYAVLREFSGGYAKDAVALVQVIKKMPVGAEGRAELLESYAGALKVVWLAMMGFAIVGGLASLWTEELSLDRELKTEQGLRTGEKGEGEGERDV